MNAGIIVLDSNFNLTGVDSQIACVFGYENEDCLDQPLNFLIPHFDKQRYLLEMPALGHKEQAMQGKTKKGETFSLEFDIHPITQQDTMSYIVTVNLLSSVFSGLRQQSVDLQSNGHHWVTYLLKSSPVVIYSCIPSGDFATTFISENITGFSGYSPEQYLSEPSFWLEHIHPDDKVDLLTEMSALFNGDESHSYEYRFLCADGHYIWVLDKLKISRNDDGDPVEMMGLWLDITQRKSDEESLAHSLAMLNEKTEALEETNNELSQFTYVVSHDLKAPPLELFIATVSG